MKVEVWVLHSPYPDGRWRGIEKTVQDGSGLPILFASKKEATEHARRGSVEYLKPWRVYLQLPQVGDEE